MFDFSLDFPGFFRYNSVEHLFRTFVLFKEAFLMILSIISALVMSGLALTMLLRAKQARTCRVALLPLAAAKSK